MSNPLSILRAKCQIDATEPLYTGFESRSIQRQTDEKQALKKALSALEKSFPKLFHIPPFSYPNFSQVWNKDVFPAIVNAVKSKNQLAKANNAIVTAINQGNAQQLWQLQVPTTLVQQKRERPFRSQQWFSHSHSLISFEQDWLANIQKSDSDETKLTHCLISAVLHSGLNETRHLQAFAECLQQQAQPLNRFEDLVWFDLSIHCTRDNKKRRFPFSCNDQYDDTPILVSRFFPTSLTLSFIATYLNNRKQGATEYSATKLIKNTLQSLGINHISYPQFCKAGIGVTEIKPNISLPEAMLEYAVKRNMAYSVTEANWLGLFQDYNAITLPKLKSVKKSPLISIKSKRVHHQHHITLLSDLSHLLRLKQSSYKRSEKMALDEMESTFGELNSFTLNEQVLLSWMTYLLTTKKLSTAKRYFDAIGAIWLSETRDIDLQNDDIDFPALYTGMLEVAISEKDHFFRAGRLEALHQHAVIHFELPPLVQKLSDSTKNIHHVRSNIVPERAFKALLNSFFTSEELTRTEQLQLAVVSILAFRAGLRLGEIFKLRLKDLEWSEALWLFIRDNQYDSNKSNAARRKIPLAVLCTEEELNLVRQWCKHNGINKAINTHPQQLFCAANTNKYSNEDKLAISNLISQTLKQICQVPKIVFHNLRHSALTRMHLILHFEDVHEIVNLKTTFVHFYSNLIPYDEKQINAIRKAVFGQHLQSYYWALAAMAGHQSPLQTFNSYLHLCDFVLYCQLQQNATLLTLPQAHAISRLSRRTLMGMRDKSGNIDIRKLYSLTVDKLQNKRFLKTHGSATSANKSPTSPKLLLPKPDKSHVIPAVHELLSLTQTGQSTAMLIWQYQLNQQEVQAWVNNAQLIANMTTSKNKPRHVAPNRQYMLIPPFPNAIAEKKDINTLIKHLRQQFKKNANTAKKELAFLVKTILSRTHSHDSAITFRHWEGIAIFLSLLTCFKKHRFDIEIYTNKTETKQQWRKVVKGCHFKCISMTQDKRNPDGQAKFRLRHPNSDNITQDKSWQRYSSSTLSFCIRLLAIISFTEEELRTIIDA